MITIEESGMIFEFKKEHIFQIESSDVQKSIGKGIKTVEFVVRFRPQELGFVEAKSSSPQPQKTNTEDFDTFITEIAEKFIHSFNLYLSVILKRNESKDIHKAFFEEDIDKVKIKFILIINGHKLEWLQPLSDALNERMKDYCTIWKSKVILMNYELAEQYHLVQRRNEDDKK